MFRWYFGKTEYDERLFARLPRLPFWAWWTLGWAIILTGWSALFLGADYALREQPGPALMLMAVGVAVTFAGNALGARGTVLWDRRDGQK